MTRDGHDWGKAVLKYSFKDRAMTSIKVNDMEIAPLVTDFRLRLDKKLFPILSVDILLESVEIEADGGVNINGFTTTKSIAAAIRLRLNEIFERSFIPCNKDSEGIHPLG